MYRFLYTERTNEKASEFETKSLLYLMSMRKDSSEINYFLIDCFNDVTGMNASCNKLWDIQSKGIKTLTPRKIGESLITLFENFLSDIDFSFYLLFFPRVDNRYLLHSEIQVFGTTNFKKEYIPKIIEGLQKEYIRRHELLTQDIMEQIQSFIQIVNFVIADEDKCNYIKRLVKFRKEIEKDDEFFNSIFNEIRDKQSALKNTSIHKKEIKEIKDVLNFNKHIKKSELEMLLINRIIGNDIFKVDGIPISFYDELKSLNVDEEMARDIIQECNSNISLMLFNNNNKKNFWEFFEIIYYLIRKYPKSTLNDIYIKIPIEKIKKIRVLNETSVKLFISLLKEGFINENN